MRWSLKLWCCKHVLYIHWTNTPPYLSEIIQNCTIYTNPFETNACSFPLSFPLSKHSQYLAQTHRYISPTSRLLSSTFPYPDAKYILISECQSVNGEWTKMYCLYASKQIRQLGSHWSLGAWFSPWVTLMLTHSHTLTHRFTMFVRTFHWNNASRRRAEKYRNICSDTFLENSLENRPLSLCVLGKKNIQRSGCTFNLSWWEKQEQHRLHIKPLYLLF